MTAIMGLSNPKDKQIFDPIRSKWVRLSPEEVIRQGLICRMVDELGYPKHLIAVEKELVKLPHLRLVPSAQIPKRRADLIVFSPASLEPLLLVECKAVELNDTFAKQVIGYNAFVKAPYIALANGHSLLFGTFDPQCVAYRFKPDLPSYFQLIEANVFSIDS